MGSPISLPSCRRVAARGAFTLIELLIVVAIIAVLAAIAVPNFMEAMTRCKVARTLADHRALASALEAYRVDTNRYPSAELFSEVSGRLRWLTTPVAYASTLPADPFHRGIVDGSDALTAQTSAYVYASGNIYAGNSSGGMDPETLRRTIWSLAGRGPDGRVEAGGYCMAHPIAVRNKSHMVFAYDPTNGTNSTGDVFRLSPGTMGGAGTTSRDD